VLQSLEALGWVGQVKSASRGRARWALLIDPQVVTLAPLIDSLLLDRLAAPAPVCRRMRCFARTRSTGRCRLRSGPAIVPRRRLSSLGRRAHDRRAFARLLTIPATPALPVQRA